MADSKKKTQHLFKGVRDQAFSKHDNVSLGTAALMSQYNFNTFRYAAQLKTEQTGGC